MGFRDIYNKVKQMEAMPMQQVKKLMAAAKAPAVGGGTYNDGTIMSAGGHIGSLGGSVGYDRSKRRVFGSVNVNGKIKGKFGPQGE
jgi:flavorubredoxin